MSVKNFKELVIWQMGVSLAVNIVKLCKNLPKSELNAISYQMRRAAYSVPSNIAEGQRRENVNEFRHFLNIARGSLAELETQLIICRDSEMLPKETTQEQIDYCIKLDIKIMNTIKSLPSRLPSQKS